MVGKTFKKAIAKAVASVTTAALCAGCFSGISFAAQPTQPSASLLLDHDTDVLSLVMDSAQDALEQNPYENLVVSDYEPYLSIYEDSSADSEVVGKLYPGSYGEIVDQGAQWTKITSGDVTGYVLSEDVAFGEDAEKLAQNIGKKVVKVTVDELNIRSGPNFYSTIIASGKKDETYRIVPEGSEYDEDTGKIRWIDENGNPLAQEPTQENTQENEQEGTQDKKQDESTSPSSEEMIEPINDTDGGQWYRIHLNDIYYGYVYADCVSVENQLDDAVTPEEEAEQNESLAAANATQTEHESTSASSEAADSQTQTSQSTKETAAQTTAPATQAPETSAPQTQETKPPQTQPPATQAPETSAPETQAPSSATTDEAYLLASLVYCEAGNQSYEGQLAVANIVLNRVKSSLFPNSISEVIYQSGQFGPVYNGSLDRTLSNGPSSACVQAANDALAGNNNIGSLLFFNNVAPSGAVSVTTIGDIVFYTYNY